VKPNKSKSTNKSTISNVNC